MVQKTAAEDAIKTIKFETANEIRAAFKQNATAEVLKDIRNQLSLRVSEENVDANDHRLLMARGLIEASPAAQDVFSVLEKGAHPSISALCIFILSCLLDLLSQHFVDHQLGQPIIKKLLSTQWLRKLELWLSGSSSDMCLASLKLLNSMSSFAGKGEQKSILEAFSWDVKVFHKLLYMRRKGKNTGLDILRRPDIRTLCLQYILSFISSTSGIKALFLEQHRDVFLAIFKGLSSDAYVVVRYVLEILWTNLWQDQRLKRTLKVGLFNETTFQHLLKIYERDAQEGSEADHIPADVVHHFLLAICSHRGIGVCFADNGWYPRHDEDDDVGRKGGRFYNKILGNVLKTLKVTDDARQQELALGILRACPELVAGYIQSAGLTLEPRLSSKWLANIAFLGSVASLPVPFDSFKLPIGIAGSSTNNAQHTYQPSPPPLVAIVDNIAPSPHLRTHLTKALQSPSLLVQHQAGLALAQCLQKCQRVLVAFENIERALEEDEAEGQWNRRRVEIEREVRKRIPEFQVIIAFSNMHRVDGESEKRITMKTAMLSELSQRLLWLYHECVPSLVAEARYDTGKSLASLVGSQSSRHIPTEVSGLVRLEQLHILRMLKESEQFLWYAKPAPSAPSNILILLQLYLKTSEGTVKATIISLLTQFLKDSLLFQHDPAELRLWINCLPSLVRRPGAKAPDGTPLTDEREAVITFLDECMQRCAKTPHRYFEDMHLLQNREPLDIGSDDEFLVERASAVPVGMSPLMMTVLEQLGAKSKNELLSPSDMLALITYTQRVLIALLGNQDDMRLCKAFYSRLKSIIDDNERMKAHPSLLVALQKEVSTLAECIDSCRRINVRKREHPTNAATSENSPEFIEELDNCNEEEEGIYRASDIIDWLRFLPDSPSDDVLKRITNRVKHVYPSAINDVIRTLKPGPYSLRPFVLEQQESWIPLDWLLLHAADDGSELAWFSSTFDNILWSQKRDLSEYKRLAGLLIHLSQRGNIILTMPLNNLALLALQARTYLDLKDFFAFKYFVLQRRAARRLWGMEDLPDGVVEGISALADVLLDPTSEQDCQIASQICKDWIYAIVSSDSLSHAPKEAIPWIKYMGLNAQFNLFGHMLDKLKESRDPSAVDVDGTWSRILDELSNRFVQSKDTSVSRRLLSHLPDLLSLRDLVATLKVMDNLVAHAAMESMPLGLSGIIPPLNDPSMESIMNTAVSRWETRHEQLSTTADIRSFLQDKWTQDTCSTVTCYIYRSSRAREFFHTWLISLVPSARPPIRLLIPALHAFFDSGTGLALGEDLVMPIFEEVSDAFFQAPADGLDKRIEATCLVSILKKNELVRIKLLECLHKHTSALFPDRLHVEAIRMAQAINRLCKQDAQRFSTATIEHALKWCGGHLSGNVENLDALLLSEVVSLIQESDAVAAHFAEPVISAATRRHLLRAPAMALATVLCKKTILKPASVNRLLQSILQHRSLDEIVASDPGSPDRAAVVDLIYRLFQAHPANTCQPSHIVPLISLYSGSLTVSDRQMLAVFHLYEEQRRSSVASIFSQWPHPGSASSRSILAAVMDLDPQRVLRTCLTFDNRWAGYEDLSGGYEASEAGDALIYDPLFILLLCSQAFAETPPNSALAWVTLYRTNVVSLVIRCLSSAVLSLRQLALAQLGRVWTLMQSADMQERDHVIHLLGLLRDQLRPPPHDPTFMPRLPSYTTLLLAHALRGIFYPSNFIYPITARFLLQRPELDITDVPMLFGLLYSSSDDWKRERAWMIRFLADGMQSSGDWRILKRRHTWDLLASLYQCSIDDRPLRHGILEVLANLTCSTQSTTSLVLKSSLIHWIEMQLPSVKADEKIAWAKIIENVLVVANPSQLERATRGEWQESLHRCLLSLLDEADLPLLLLISRCLVRLDSGSLTRSFNIQCSLQRAVKQLTFFERQTSLNLSRQRIVERRCLQEVLPPHRSQGLHQLVLTDDMKVWGDVVEKLWSVCMTHDVGGTVWDGLTCRVLVWRAASSAAESEVGEWARQQAILALQGVYN